MIESLGEQQHVLQEVEPHQNDHSPPEDALPALLGEARTQCTQVGGKCYEPQAAYHQHHDGEHGTMRESPPLGMVTLERQSASSGHNSPCRIDGQVARAHFLGRELLSVDVLHGAAYLDRYELPRAPGRGTEL